MCLEGCVGIRRPAAQPLVVCAKGGRCATAVTGVRWAGRKPRPGANAELAATMTAAMSGVRSVIPRLERMAGAERAALWMLTD